MNESQQIARNTFIQLVGKVIITAIALVGFGLVTRYLGQQGFGYFATIYAFLAIFGILVDLGLQMTTTRLISDPAENEGEILSNALTIRFVASLIFLSIAPLVILFFPYPGIVKVGVAVAAVGFVFASLVSTITSFFQKNLIMGQVVFAEITAKLVYLAATVFAVYSDWGLIGIIAAVILDSLIVFLILLSFASKKALVKPKFNPVVWKKILIHTWPIAVTIALNLVYFKGDIFIMSLIRSQSEVGLYGAPYRVLEVLINIVYIFLGLVLPVLAASYAVKNIEKIKQVVQSTFNFLIIFTVPMIVGGFFLGKDMMIMLTGEEFAVSGDIIKILFIATGGIFIASLFGYVIVAMDKQKEMIKFYFINAILSIAGYTYFISKYSYWGAAGMTIFTELFILISAGYVMVKHLKFFPDLKILLKTVIASAVMSLPLIFLNNLHFAILIIIGAIVYFLALYGLKGIDKKTILNIISIRKNETFNN